MLIQRVLTTVALALLLAGLLYSSQPWVWPLFVLVTGVLASEEWAALQWRAWTLKVGYASFSGLIAALIISFPEAHSAALIPLFMISALFWLILVPVWLARQWTFQSHGLHALTGWLVIVPTMLAVHELKMQGVAILVLSMAVIWISDVSAYFVGRAFGKTLLAPSISPGKTWEGVLGALLGVVCFGFVLQGLSMFDAQLANLISTAGWYWFPALMLLAILGIEGDLFESWLKRCAGVKDSGWILPGHGGVLDRIDALTAALPIAAGLLVWAALGEKHHVY
jgi:phosphatidate cytidylyltransferase